MDYIKILIGIGILLLCFIVYKKRHKISSFFSGKEKESQSIDNNTLKQPTDEPKKEIKKKVKKENKEDLCYLDIAISPKEDEVTELGRIILKLHSKECPKTCENFKSLCKIEYKNCLIHRLIPGFMFQTGDYENNDGTGGASIYGAKFSDENLLLKHYKRGIVSMANSGPNTNGSQFFITFNETHHLDEKHVVFGEMVDGFDVLDKIEKIPTNEKDEPIPLLYILNSGILGSKEKVI